MFNPLNIFRKKTADPADAAGKGPIPRHVAIIMDGNRRWAEKRRLPKIAGYKYGLEALRDNYNSCISSGIEYMTIYAYSTENKTDEHTSY